MFSKLLKLYAGKGIGSVTPIATIELKEKHAILKTRAPHVTFPTLSKKDLNDLSQAMLMNKETLNLAFTLMNQYSFKKEEASELFKQASNNLE